MAEQKPIKLAYVVAKPADEGKPGLNPVILHHGMTLSKERWNPILQKLADSTGRKVYAVDARNHGESERSDYFTVDIMSKDLLHFMDTHGIQKGFIVGHSMGGWIAMRTALQAPERVETMIVEDITPTDLTPEVTGFLKLLLSEQQKCIEQSKPEDSIDFIEEKLRECTIRCVPNFPEDQLEVLRKMKFYLNKTDTGYESRTNIKVLLKALEDPKTLTGKYEGVYKGYLLMLYGEKSISNVGKHKDLILKFFPDARFYEFMGAGHEILEQFPDSYFSTLVRFINGS